MTPSIRIVDDTDGWKAVSIVINGYEMSAD